MAVKSPFDRWTDGWGSDPLETPVSVVFVCPHCELPQSRASATVIQMIRGKNVKQMYPGARDAISPTFDDFMAILAEHPVSKNDELEMRIKAWQAGNHPRRANREPTEFSRCEQQNLQTLLTLLEGNDEGRRLLKAEILRELGEFELSCKALSQDASRGNDPLSSRLRELNLVKNRFVARFSPRLPKNEH
jgi:hypothetical protein